MTRTRLVALAAAAAAVLSTNDAKASPVTFSSSTATFSQAGYAAANMIDGNLSQGNGWADDSGGQTLSQTALLTVSSLLGFGQKTITFTIFQNYGESHELGNFSLSYATDAAPTLTSVKKSFSNTSATAVSGATFTQMSAGTFLVGGADSGTDVYTITGTTTSALPITGIFLDVIESPSNGLATGGPGRAANGNFVVTEITADAVSAVSAVPEPSTYAFMLLGVAAVGAVRLKRSKVN